VLVVSRTPRARSIDASRAGRTACLGAPPVRMISPGRSCRP
jgi:hypothetical protein